jgi:hypothetical protein
VPALERQPRPHRGRVAWRRATVLLSSAPAPGYPHATAASARAGLGSDDDGAAVDVQVGQRIRLTLWFVQVRGMADSCGWSCSISPAICWSWASKWLWISLASWRTAPVPLPVHPLTTLGLGSSCHGLERGAGVMLGSGTGKPKPVGTMPLVKSAHCFEPILQSIVT